MGFAMTSATVSEIIGFFTFSVVRMSSFGANWDCPKTGDSDWFPMIRFFSLYSFVTFQV